MVARLVIDAQEPHVYPARREHGNLELHVDRRPAPCLSPDGRDQVHFCRQHAFRLAREALHPPHDRLLLRLVLCPSERVLDLGFCCVLGNRYLDHHVRREQLVREVGDDLQVDGNASISLLLLNGRNNPEGQVDVVRDTIPHELELPVRRDEGDGPVGLELAQADASVEGAVRDLHAWLADVRALVLDDELIVKAKLALRHARKLCIHLHSPRDLVPEDVTSAGEEEIDALQDIDVHLVLLVADPLPPPIDRPGDLAGELGRLRLVLRPNVT